MAFGDETDTSKEIHWDRKTIDEFGVFTETFLASDELMAGFARNLSSRLRKLRDMLEEETEKHSGGPPAVRSYYTTARGRGGRYGPVIAQNWEVKSKDISRKGSGVTMVVGGIVNPHPGARAFLYGSDGGGRMEPTYPNPFLREVVWKRNGKEINRRLPAGRVPVAMANMTGEGRWPGETGASHFSMWFKNPGNPPQYDILDKIYDTVDRIGNEAVREGLMKKLANLRLGGTDRDEAGDDFGED